MQRSSSEANRSLEPSMAVERDEVGRKEEEHEFLKPSQPPYLEVLCKTSGKVRRFAVGTEARFALYLINRKMAFGLPPALHIEASKEGEESVSFGPNALLVNYGPDWKLKTVTEEVGHEEARSLQQMRRQFPAVMQSASFHSTEKHISNSSSNVSHMYILKILLAFVFIFLFAGILTLFLENLPSLINALDSS